jgi:hypothetical protein
MTISFSGLAAELTAKAAIGADDTLALRRVAWPDGKIDPAEADAIFDLNTLCKETSPEWVDFFVEAITEYVVHQQQPVGYVDDAQANWLMAKIDSDGRVDSLGELTLLVKILEAATNVPDALKTYALRQIEQVVLTGEGPTRDGGSLDTGSISEAEVKLLRRILFAQASDGPGLISRAEADMLFRVKDATLGANNGPGWQQLFVQAVGNHLMAHSDYAPLARDEAARLDAFMNDTHVSIGGFFSRIGKANFTEAFSSLFGAKAARVDHDASVAADRAIAPDEAAWLKAQIDADGSLDPLEKALLAFVADESGESVRS